MKRLGKSVVLLISVALLVPTLAHGADSIPEQWAPLPAPGFTYSNPTIKVRLSQEGSSTPAQTPTAAKKTSITCVKGKTTKKVTAVNPKCPTGYKKK